MKNTIIYKLRWFYVASLIILLFASCDPLKLFGGKTSDQYSLSPIEGLSTSYIPNEKFFYVNLSAGYYIGEGYDPLDSIIYAMDEGPGTDCKIPVEQESTEDLYCIMDVMEGDLWFHEIVLEYNVPEQLCDYLDFEVPWHFNQSIGRGPNTVHVCNDYFTGCSDGETPTPETETRYCLGGCNKTTISLCPGENQVTTSCRTDTTASPQEEAQNFCSSLDLSENDLANCCFGDYTLISEGTSSTANWGGDFQNCIGGMARFSWTSFNQAGVPIILTTNTLKAGLRETYTLPALINTYDGHYDDISTDAKLKRPTFITANYWTDVEDKDSVSNRPKFYTAPTEAQLPKDYLEPLHVNQSSGYPYLTWSCLDKAREIKHRIHLIVREWNTQEEYDSFKDTKGSRGDPDVVGQEGSICQYYEAGEGSILKSTECNDAIDADDWDSQGHGTSRGYNPYPMIIYK